MLLDTEFRAPFTGFTEMLVLAYASTIACLSGRCVRTLLTRVRMPVLSQFAVMSINTGE
jgi:hypothetical protein